MKILLLSLIIGIAFVFQSCSRSSQTYFKDLIGFSPTEDVTNLNSFSDELGIDASYWLAFECHDSTASKIATKLQLTKSEVETNGLTGGLNMNPTLWWDTSFVLHSKPFYREKDGVFWYLWYDNKAKKAYFLTFDL